MQMLYVCVLCASGGSSQRSVLHDLQYLNAGRGCMRRSSGVNIEITNYKNIIYVVVFHDQVCLQVSQGFRCRDS